MLGPVLERLQTEAQDPIIDRVFGIMQRGGLFPDPPAELQGGAPIQVVYVSMLAAAQNAANTTGMERFLAQVGNIAGVHPDVLDIPNWDRMMTRYGMVLGNEPSDINTPDEIAAIRQAKAKAQQAEQMNQVSDTSKGFADAAKNLSATDVGGGTNALQAILGGAPT